MALSIICDIFVVESFRGLGSTVTHSTPIMSERSQSGAEDNT